MNITASFHGILAEWVGVQSARFDLPSNATYEDLLVAFHHRYALNMPDQLWDKRKNCFAKEVIISGKGTISKLMKKPLMKNEEIVLLLMIAGG